MDLLAQAALTVADGLFDGVVRAVGLLIVCAAAAGSYTWSRAAFRDAEFEAQFHPPGERRARLASTTTFAIFMALIVAVFLTLMAGFTSKPGCVFLDDCAMSISRSEREVIATFVTAFLVLAVPVILARRSYWESSRDDGAA